MVVFEIGGSDNPEDCYHSSSRFKLPFLLLRLRFLSWRHSTIGHVVFPMAYGPMIIPSY